MTTKTCLQVSRWGKYIQKGTIYFVSCAALSVNFINCFPICMCKIQLKVDKGSFTKLAEKKKSPKSSLHVESFLLKRNCQYLQLKQRFTKHFHMFKKGALLIYLWTEMLFYNPVQANNKIDMFCSPPLPPQKKAANREKKCKIVCFYGWVKVLLCS